MASGGTLNFTGFYLGTGAALTIGEFDARTVEILNLSTGAKTTWSKEFVDLDSAKRGGMVQLAATLTTLPVPELVSRSGLASNATQVHSIAGPIYAVIDSAGTANLAMVSSTAGAGEVTVTYDANGLATLIFGDGAVTAYRVLQSRLTAPVLVDWLTEAEGVSSADSSAGFTVGTDSHVNGSGVQYFYRITN